MPNNYVAPYLLSPRSEPVPTEGQFTVPVCTTPERFDKIMNALFYYGQHQKQGFDFDHLIDWLAGVNNIVEGCVDFAPICRTIGLHDERLVWYPESPFEPHEEVPTGYPFHPFTVVSGSTIDGIISVFGLGYKIGDVFVDLTKLPVFTSWFDITENYANMPSLTITNLSGRGKVKIHLLNIVQGGRILVLVDGELDLLHLRTIEVGRDAISFPPETEVDFIVEVDVEHDGEHTVTFVWYPTVDVSAIPVSFGGGVRNIELCGFNVSDLPSDPCCPETNDLLSTNNVWLEKIYNLMKGGMIARIKFEEGVLPPDESGGDCAPDHFDHDGDETGSELVIRYNALCMTVHQYVKALLLKALRDMNAPQALVDFVSSKFPDVIVPLTLSNLTVIYPSTFSGINTFFDALTDNIDLSEIACAMLDGLTGDKNNTSQNFGASLDSYEGTALMNSFVRLVSASNKVTQNYKDFNTTLNANKDVEGIEDYECPCGSPSPTGDCGGFIPVDWNGSGTTFVYMGNCVWQCNSGSGSPYNSSVKDLFDRPFYVSLPEPELGFPLPGCSSTEQIGSNGCPDKVGGCNFTEGLWEGCYSTIQWDSGTPNYYKFRLCTELDECP